MREARRPDPRDRRLQELERLARDLLEQVAQLHGEIATRTQMALRLNRENRERIAELERAMDHCPECHKARRKIRLVGG